MNTNYKILIGRALPNAQIKLIDNFNDVHFGWEISPEPRNLIVFKVRMDSPWEIEITRYSISYFYDEPKLRHSTVFRGDIPPNKKSEPDFDFIEQVLKNYLSFGN